MLLKKKKADTPNAPRSTLEQAARAGAAPGQRILAIIAGLGGVLIILGGVTWRYIWPAYKGQQAPAVEQQAATSGKPIAPTLYVPLDVNATPAPTAQKNGNETFSGAPGLGADARPSQAQAGATRGAPAQIGAAGTTSSAAGKGLPPNMEGRVGNDGSYQANSAPPDGAEDPHKRKLDGDLGSIGDAAGPTNLSASPQPRTVPVNYAPGAQPGLGGPAGSQQPPAASQNALAAQLVPIATPDGSASIVPHPHLTLKKGEPITCTLDTAIQTDQVGFVECITDYPIYSMDGTTLLAERGTRIEGEYSRDMSRGSNAIFVLWTKATTPAPHNVRFELLSPGTDRLGRAGIRGQVDNKFWERYSGPLVFSVLQDVSAIAAAKASHGQSSGVVVLPSTQNAGQSAVAELLKQGADIKPSLYANQGDTISITVARYIDFSNVYKLRPVKAVRQ
jgi:type IV secretion system protein VirB10